MSHWTDDELRILLAEYESCISLPDLATRLNRSAKQCMRRANKAGLVRQSKTAMERREIQICRAEASDTSGIVASALAAQIDLERAWR